MLLSYLNISIALTIFDICVRPELFPLVEQIVASRAKVFVGTYYSTFSAYISRLRGYYSVKEKQEGFMTGSLPNTYFLPSEYKREMSLYQAVHEPLFARAFQVAWRDIDRLELPPDNSQHINTKLV